MSYSDVGVHNLADSGAYGTIPESEYFRKISVVPTTYQEDAEQVDNYMRGLMKDFRPDAPFLASDEVRDPSDRGGGTHSAERLALRHGGKYGDLSEPYLPDGSFTDWQFLERDPRGIATGPDMRKHMEQQYARASLIKFYNDDDWSVPETAINPTQMVSNVKSCMYKLKDRYKNFEESMDGWHNGYQSQRRTGGNDIAKQTADGTIMDLTESSVRNRRDAVNQLSDDPTIGYRYTVPDHRFKIARYGMIRANQTDSHQDWDTNRRAAHLDHANMAIIDGTRVNKMLARLIVDLEGIRGNKQLVAQGAAYNDSEVNQIAKKRLTADDIYKITRIGGFNTHAATANEMFDGSHVQRYGSKPLNDRTAASQNVRINHFITQSMEQATKKQKAMNVDGFKDLREKIKQTASDAGIYNEATTRRMTEKMRSANMTRSAIDTRHIDDQKEVANYASIAPAQHRKTQQNSDYEAFASNSHKSIERAGRRKGHALKNTSDHEQDQSLDTSDFGGFDKAFKEDPNCHVGRNIYNYDFGDTTRQDEVGEITTRAFRMN